MEGPAIWSQDKGHEKFNSHGVRRPLIASLNSLQEGECKVQDPTLLALIQGVSGNFYDCIKIIQA